MCLLYGMRALITKCSIAVLLLGGATGIAHTAKKDMKDAGQDVKEAGKDTGRAAKNAGKGTAKAAKTTGHKVKHATHKAADKVADKTKQ